MVDVNDFLVQHSGHAGGSSNPVREFLGYKALQVISASFHTAGAILWLGGIVTFLIWQRMLWEGHASPMLKWRSAVTCWAAMGLNFLGGTMRLFEPGHPGLEKTGESAWVVIILAKHILLLAAVAMTLLLQLREGPRMIHQYRHGTVSEVQHQRVRMFGYLVLACIIVSALLGSLTLVYPAA